MASEDIFDRLSRTNKRRKKSSKRAKPSKIACPMSDSDDYTYPGTYGMEDNDDDDFQDEIEYGNNKLVLKEEGHDDSNAEEEDNYLNPWSKPSWLECDETPEEDDDEEDIYSLGFISRDSRSWRPPQHIASSSVTPRSTDDEQFSDQTGDRREEQTIQQQRTANVVRGPQKRQRPSSDDEDTQWDTINSSSDNNIHDMLERYPSRRGRAKCRRFTPQSSSAQSSQFNSNINYGAFSDESSTSASPAGYTASSSSSDIQRQLIERGDHDQFIFEAYSSSSSSSSCHSDDDFPVAISRRTSVGLSQSRVKYTPQSRRQSMHLQTPTTFSSEQSVFRRHSTDVTRTLNILMDEADGDTTMITTPEAAYLSDSLEASDYEDSLDDDREYALADAYRNAHITPPSRERQIPSNPYESRPTIREIRQNFTVRPFDYGDLESDQDEVEDEDEEIDDELVARRLQEQEFAHLAYSRSGPGSLGGPQAPFFRRAPAPSLNLGRNLPISVTISRGRSRSQTHSSQASSLYGESDNLGSDRDASEEISSAQNDDEDDEQRRLLLALEVIFSGAVPRDPQRRGPLTERHEFSTLYQSLTSLGEWNAVATNPMNYMADDEFDNSYEGLWRLSERIGYERQRGLSAEARRKLSEITWRQYQHIQHQHIARALSETSKGKERARQTPPKIEQRCSICLDDYAAMDRLWILPCHHEFHKDCVNRWFENSQKCPICRHDIEDA